MNVVILKHCVRNLAFCSNYDLLSSDKQCYEIYWDFCHSDDKEFQITKWNNQWQISMMNICKIVNACFFKMFFLKSNDSNIYL